MTVKKSLDTFLVPEPPPKAPGGSRWDDASRSKVHLHDLDMSRWAAVCAMCRPLHEGHTPRRLHEKATMKVVTEGFLRHPPAGQSPMGLNASRMAAA
jgi:hypothetical protein